MFCCNLILRPHIKNSMKNLNFLNSAFENFQLIILIGSIVCYALYTEQLSDSVINAISACTQILIPTLFSSILICSFIAKAQSPEKLTQKTHILTNKLFGLSGNCTVSIFSGLLLGYNSSYVNAVSLYKDKKISLKEAQRLALIFNGPGLSFCISFAGLYLYHSYRIGLIFLFSNIISSLLLAIIINLKDNNNTKLVITRKNTITNDSFINAIKDTTQILLSICSFEILFYCLKTIVKTIIPIKIIIQITEIFGEVLSGLTYCKQFNNLILSSFCLFFGGFCIFLQQLPLMKELKIRTVTALLTKFVSAFLSALTVHILNIFLPFSTEVFSYSFKLSANNSFLSSYSLLLLVTINISVLIAESNKIRYKNVK